MTRKERDVINDIQEKGDSIEGERTGGVDRQMTEDRV